MASIKALLFDQFHYGVSPLRRNLLSGFSLGIFASFILFSLLLLTPVFLGLNTFGSFYLPYTSTNSTTNSVIQAGKHSKIDQNARITTTPNEKESDLESTQIGDLDVIVKNVSLHGQESKQTGEHTSTKTDSIARITNPDEKGSNPDATQMGDFGVIVKNVSFHGRESKQTGDLVGNYTANSKEIECDMYDGKWVKDDEKNAYYEPGSCPHIDRAFNCYVNGRIDDGFLKWRWQPFGCDIPSLNASDFLERLRGKKLVFVGDSLNRNMWESLVCILRHNITPKNRVYEISGRRDFKKKGIYAFRFEDYDCTVDFVVAPFLVRESSFQGKNGKFETLRLDLMDRSTEMYHDADVIVFNTGHWWTHEKTSRGEEYYQEGNYVYPRLKVMEAYKKALSTWAKWVDSHINTNKTLVFFRGYSVTHFRGGQWNSGGQCHKESDPIFNETYLTKYPRKMRALEHVLSEMKTPVTYLNISRLTDYRKDGHPSIFRKSYQTELERLEAEQSQDCSHWCLPGVPDTWNELLYASLLKVGWGS